VIAFAGLWAFGIEPASLAVQYERIHIRALQAPRPLRVAVLTDLHVGSPFNGIDKLRRIVDRTNAERPDIICILGDLVVQGVPGGRFVSPEAIGVELKRLRAGSGVFAVLGKSRCVARSRAREDRTREQRRARARGSAPSWWRPQAAASGLRA
jgi:uncharacterized protein